MKFDEFRAGMEIELGKQERAWGALRAQLEEWDPRSPHLFAFPDETDSPSRRAEASIDLLGLRG